MTDRIVKLFLESEEVLDESILLDSLVKKLRSLEMTLASKFRKDDPRYIKIAHGFRELKSLIASLS